MYQRFPLFSNSNDLIPRAIGSGASTCERDSSGLEAWQAGCLRSMRIPTRIERHDALMKSLKLSFSHARR